MAWYCVLRAAFQVAVTSWNPSPSSTFEVGTAQRLAPCEISIREGGVSYGTTTGVRVSVVRVRHAIDVG